MLAPTGIGVLYGKKDLLKKMGPFQGGGEMIKEVIFQTKRKSNVTSVHGMSYPGSLKQAHQTSAGAIGLAAAIKYLEQIGMDNVLAHEKALTKYAVKGMKELQQNNPSRPNKSF